MKPSKKQSKYSHSPLNKNGIRIKNLEYFRDSLIDLSVQIRTLDKGYAGPLSLKMEAKGLARLTETTQQLLVRVQKRIDILDTHGQPSEDSTA